MKLLATSVKALGMFLGICLCSHLVAEDRQQLDELQRSISKLQKTLKKGDQEKNQLQNELMSVELKVSALNGSLRELGDKISTLQRRQGQLRERKTSFQSGIEEQRKALSQHLNAAYKMGAQEPIKLLLNQRDPSKFSRVFSYYNYFSQSRTDQIATYETSVAALDEVLTTIQREKLDIDNSRASLANNQGELLSRKQQRQKTLDKLQVSLASDQKKLDQWQRQRARLQQVLTKVERASRELTLPDDYVPIASRKGTLNWPLKGRLLKRFGNTRSGSLRWEGWLISSPAGTPVNTVHQGRIVFSNYLRGFGLLIIVDHGDSFMSLYAHNQELLKDTGDWVETGDILAHSGDSGGLDKPALYFEIRKQGKPRNPKSWLKTK